MGLTSIDGTGIGGAGSGLPTPPAPSRRVGFAARRDRVLTLGIHTPGRYLAIGEERRFSGARVAYNLLDIGDNPTPEEVRIFEDICFTLQIANGTFRATYRNRFPDLNEAAIATMRRMFAPSAPLRIQDRAASSGLTSAEWAHRVFEEFPGADFEASDTLRELIEWSPAPGETYILEPGGAPLQYISPPFVVSLLNPEPWINPARVLAARRGLRRLRTLPSESGRRKTISLVHPEARALGRRTPRFRFTLRSVFDATPGASEVVRTMNILNRSYFPDNRLREAAGAIFESVAPGGLWILGRTLEEDFSNHATFFRRAPAGWEAVERFGRGSDVEDIALAFRP